MRNVVFAIVAAVVAGGLYLAVKTDVPDQDPLPVLPGSAGADAPAPAPAKKESTDEEPRPVVSKSGPWPKVTVEETHFEFGDMAVGTEREHTFVLRNDGEADLELVAGQPTCKCTAFELSKKTVKPGESSELLVRWIGKFKDQMFQHGGPVYTNDPERESVRFTVAGIVDADFEVQPTEKWNVGEIVSDQAGSMDAVVFSKIHDDFKITSIESDSPMVTTEISELTAEDMQKVHLTADAAFKVKVTVSKDVPPGFLESHLAVGTSHSSTPFTITVTAHKAGPIRILPTPGVDFSEATHGLRLGQFPASEGRSVDLNVLVEESPDGPPLELKDVVSTPSFIELKLEPIQRSAGGKSRYKMTVRIPPGIPRSQRDVTDPATINAATNHPSGQDVFLKLSYKAF
ncbi:MAG: DUF1573 domain-containing protein [Planctomycetaceae bacterium]